MLYGFCVQAGLGVALWMLARLGRTRWRRRGWSSSARFAGTWEWLPGSWGF